MNPHNRFVWDNTRMDFIDAFKDTGKQIIALHELEQLKMKPGEVDAYISRFNRLLPIVSFSTTDSGVINMFRRGVHYPLLKEVILHKSKPLITLKDWQDETREKQLAWWDAQQATGGGISNRKQQLYQRYQIPTQCRNNQPQRDPNAMDVDAQCTKDPDISTFSGWSVNNELMNATRNVEMDGYRTGPDGRPIFTDKQKDALRILGGCYRCGELKHISPNCKNFPPGPRANPSGVTFPNRGRGRGWQPRGGGGNRGGPPGPRAARLEPKLEGPTWTRENLTRDHLDQVVMGIKDVDERADYLENLFGPDF